MIQRVIIGILFPALLLVMVTGCGVTPQDRNTISAADNGESAGAATTSTSAPQTLEIPFSVGACIQIDEYTAGLTSDFSGRILQSKEQLHSAGLSELEIHPAFTGSSAVDTAKYTEEYFSEKALLLLYFRVESASFQLNAETLVRNDDTLLVQYTSQRPNPSVTMGAAWCVLLEVDQAHVAGVQKINGEEHNDTLPSGVMPE